MNLESRTAEFLASALNGEQVVTAVTASTKRWYTIFSQFNAGERLWDLVLTPERLLIAEHVGDWVKHPRSAPAVYLNAQRSDVRVERFWRTGVGSWWMKLDVITAGKWSLHGSLLFGRGNERKAREIADALGFGFYRPR